MEQLKGSTGDLDAMDGRRRPEFLPGGKGEGKLLEPSGRCSEGEEDEDDEDGGGSLHSLQSHVTFASLPSYMRSKSGLEMDPDRVSSPASNSCFSNGFPYECVHVAQQTTSVEAFNMVYSIEI